MIEVLVAALTLLLAVTHGRRIAAAATRRDPAPVQIAAAHAVVFCALGAAGVLDAALAPAVLAALWWAATQASRPAAGAPAAAAHAAAVDAARAERAHRALAAIATLRGGIDALEHERRGAIGRRALLRRMRGDAARLHAVATAEFGDRVPSAAVSISSVSLPELIGDLLREAADRDPAFDVSCVVERDLPRLIESDDRVIRASLTDLLRAAAAQGPGRAELLVSPIGDELGLGVAWPVGRAPLLADAVRARIAAAVGRLGGRLVALPPVAGQESPHHRVPRQGLQIVLPLFPAPDSDALWGAGRIRRGADDLAIPSGGLLWRRRTLLVASGRAHPGIDGPVDWFEAEGAEVDAVDSLGAARALVALDPRAHEIVVLVGGIADVMLAARELRELGVRAPFLASTAAEARQAAALAEQGVTRLDPDAGAATLLREAVRLLARTQPGADLDGCPAILSRLEHDRRFAAWVERFVDTVPVFLEELHDARRRGDRDRLLRLARQLVRSGSRYGFDRVSERAASLARAIDGSEPDERVEAGFVGLSQVLAAILSGGRPRLAAAPLPARTPA